MYIINSLITAQHSLQYTYTQHINIIFTYHPHFHNPNHNQHMSTNINYQQIILQSIVSEDSDQFQSKQDNSNTKSPSPKQQVPHVQQNADKLKEKQTQSDRKQESRKQVHYKQNNRFMDEDSLQFGASVYENKMMYFNEKKDIKDKNTKSRSSSGSDWNMESQQIASSGKKKNEDRNYVDENKIKGKQMELRYPTFGNDTDRGNIRDDGKKSSDNKFNRYQYERQYDNQADEFQNNKNKNNKKYQIPTQVNKQMSLGDRFHKMRANVGQISPGVNTNTNNYNEDELIDINKSMIGVRNTKKNIILQEQDQLNHIDQIKQEKNAHRTKIQTKKYNGQKSQLDNQSLDGSSSFSSFNSVYLKKSGIVLKTMDTTMYWTYDDKQIRIGFETLQSFVQQFFKKQVMLPMVSQQQFKSEHVIQYMHLYTEFLNQMFSGLFKNVFGILKNSNKSGYKDKFSGYDGPHKAMTPKANSQKYGFGKYLDYLPKILKGSQYSKAELIKNHKINQLRILKYLLHYRETNTQCDSNANKGVYNPVSQPKIVQQKKKQILEQIAFLQLLLSFERSQKYCQTYSTEGIDQTIWKQHIKKLQQLRRKWIIHVQDTKKINLSFKI